MHHWRQFGNQVQQVQDRGHIHVFCEHCKQVMNITACMFELEIKQRTSLNIQLRIKQFKQCFILISEWGGKLREMLVGLTSKKADSKALHYNHTQFIFRTNMTFSLAPPLRLHCTQDMFNDACIISSFFSCWYHCLLLFGVQNNLIFH